jgi:hypothetical protein
MPEGRFNGIPFWDPRPMNIAATSPLDDDGNIFVTGQSNATWGSPVNPYAGGSDAFVAKLDNDGGLQWNTFLGSAVLSDRGYGLGVDQSGNILVTGRSNATWGSPLNPHAGSSEVFVAKLDNDGALLWNTFLGSASLDYGYALALDDDGNIFVTGESRATWGNPVNQPSGSKETFVAKVHSGGALEWNTFLGSEENDSGWGIAVSDGGNVFVTGNSYASWGVPVNPHAGGCDAFAAKLSGSGVLQWNTFMGSIKSEWGYGIALDGGDNVYVAGESDNISWGDPVHPFTGASDAFVVRLDKSGIRQWNTFLGCSAYDYCWRISLEGPSNIYVTGESPHSWGTPVNPHAGDFDVFVAKMRQTSGLEDLLGTWSGQGVYYRDSDTGGWVPMSAPAAQIAAGDLDDDGIDDLIGTWPAQGGIWAKYSSDGGWVNLSTTADWIGAGDMNGDDHVDLLGTWTGQGVFFRDIATGAWQKLASPASQIACGDFDGDGTDDLVGMWADQGGVWVKHSGDNSWQPLSSTADWIGAGDMNGDARADLLGTWAGQGVFYRDTATGAWYQMASSASQITCGDLDGDGLDDLVGIWPGQGGVWAKYSQDSTWERLADTADWIACGRMGDSAANVRIGSSPMPFPKIKDGPFVTGLSKGALVGGPGSPRFRFIERPNLVPRLHDTAAYLPGPGEPGFIYREQVNLVPGEVKSKRKTGRLATPRS